MKPYYVNLTKCYSSGNGEIKVIDKNQFNMHIFAEDERSLNDKMLAKGYVVIGAAQLVFPEQQ